jgi:hypothetical protein
MSAKRHALTAVIAGLDPAIRAVARFMDARVIGVRKHAVLRTAMPAHDAESLARIMQWR